MSKENTDVLKNVTQMFANKSESEKAFILGYMVAIEQQKKTAQVMTAQKIPLVFGQGEHKRQTVNHKHIQRETEVTSMARARELPEDPIKEVRVLHFPNATFYVQIPDLTPEEYERRMNKIKEAAANLLVNGKKS